jgi:hypothetical protein
LSRPLRALGTLARPGRALGTLSCPLRALGTLSCPLRALGTLSCPLRTRGALTCPLRTLGTLSRPLRRLGTLWTLGHQLITAFLHIGPALLRCHVHHGRTRFGDFIAPLFGLQTQLFIVAGYINLFCERLVQHLLAILKQLAVFLFSPVAHLLKTFGLRRLTFFHFLQP